MNTEQRIDQWLRQRQKLLVQLCSIHESSNKKILFPSVKKRDALFEELLDYVCAGHFEIFQHFISEIEKHASLPKNTTQDILTQIQASTDLLVQLNDKYYQLKRPMKNEWRADISLLVEQLAERFELEDQLIENSLAQPKKHIKSA